MVLKSERSCERRLCIERSVVEIEIVRLKSKLLISPY